MTVFEGDLGVGAVELDNGERIDFEYCLICTGSTYEYPVKACPGIKVGRRVCVSAG